MADRTIAYRFTGDFGNLTAGLTAAGRQTAAFGRNLTAMDANGARMRQGLDQLGGTAGKVGLVAAVGLGAVVTAAANFDQAMSRVQASTHETADNMALLRDAAIKAGASTKYSATEAAGAMEELAKAGVSTKDILGGGLSGALNLAAAGNLEVADAAEIAASALTQFQLKGTDVNHVADLLAAGAGKAQGSVSDLGMALNQSGLVAAQTGLSIEETVGTISAFASAGLIGSDAGTSFKTMLQSLTPSSKESSEAMKAMGFSAYDAQGNFKGMTQVADDLRAGLSTMTVEQQNATLKTIFGSDAVRAASIIYQQGGDGIQSWIDKTNDSGYAAETAATAMDNLKGDLEQFGGALETALIGAGSGAQGPLRSLVQGATDVVNAFNALPGPVQGAATALLAITAVTGGSLWFGAKVIGGIAATRLALADLGLVANTTTGSLVATRGAIAGVAGVTGVAVIGLGAIGDSISALDSIKRNDGALDSTAGSVDELNAALAKSNVGKYASDLGIDVQLLSRDLAANGSSGKYAAEVLGKLGNASHGAGAAVKEMAGTILPFYTASSTKAYDANQDLKNIIEGMPPALSAQTKAATSAVASYLGFGKSAADVKGLANSSEAAAAAALRGKQATIGWKDALEAFNAVLTGRGSMREYQAALDAMQQSIKDNGRSLDITTEKGRNNQSALDGIASSALSAAEGLRGIPRKNFLAGARQEFLQAANDLGMTREAAVRLANSLGLLGDKKETPKVGLEDGEFKRGKNQAERGLNDLGRKKVNPKAGIDITGLMRGAGTAKGAVNGLGGLRPNPTATLNDQVTPAVGRARGALADLDGTTATTYIKTIRSYFGLPKADGGFISGPGGPRDDKIPAMLSNGEFVINAAATSRNLPLLHQINSQRFADGGRVQKFASGGKATAFSDGFAAFSGGNIERSLKSLEKALDRNKSALDKARETRTAYASSVTDNLRSDIFGTSNDPWSGAGNDPLSILRADIANAGEFNSLRSSFGGRIKGDALASIDTLDKARVIGNLSAADQREFARLSAQRNAVTASAGNAAGLAAYGNQAALVAEVKGLRVDVRRLEQANKRNSDDNAEKTGQKVGGAVSGAAARAQRRRPYSAVLG